eukprot:1004652-Amphidinium_carterae.1
MGVDHYYWMTANASTPEARLKRLKPLAWVHVPWAGDAFVNALLQHPGLCPGFRGRVSFTDKELQQSGFRKE